MKMIRITIFLILLILFLYLENNLITVTHIKFESAKVPESFNGFKIVQLSDLHNKVFGKKNNKLISKIRKEKPNLIVITGDLIDVNHYNENIIIDLLNKLVSIAPIYYVTGNHEVNFPKFNDLEKKIIASGIHILRNESAVIGIGNESISLLGIDDPGHLFVSNNALNKKILKDELEKASQNCINTNLKLLLSHRPEQFSLYVKYNIDLIFSGHAHGGQIRLPFIGGIIGTGQVFPLKYTSGKYDNGNSSMIVSRGLGNGSIPQRLFNRPEVVVVILQKS